MNMKKFFFIISAILLFWAGSASAVTFEAENCLYVSEDQNGVVTVTGEPSDISKITMLVQFSPDKFKVGSPDNRYITPTSKNDREIRFQMNMSSARSGQRAFNLKSGSLWLRIPHKLVVVGKNLILENSLPSPDSEDGRGGAHFVYTPAIN